MALRAEKDKRENHPEVERELKVKRFVEG